MKLTNVLLMLTFFAGLFVLAAIFRTIDTHDITFLAVTLAVFNPLLALSVPRARAEKETWRGW